MTTEPVAVAAGCAWPVDPACFEESWEALDDEVQDRAIALASSTLTRLTGYRVGGCPITVRPCIRSCWDTRHVSYYDMLSYGGGVSFWPHLNSQGLWVNSCGHGPDCSCGPIDCMVHLPAPVGPVTLVMNDGLEVDAEDYRIIDGALVWSGEGDCPWPSCQDLSKPDTEEGTFSVTYLNAYPVDTVGAYAAGLLAMEFAKACTGGKCRLPSGVTRVARQGVSFDVVTGMFPDGFTGIREVDTFIALWNPNHVRQQTQVWTPDVRRTHVSR